MSGSGPTRRIEDWKPPNSARDGDGGGPAQGGEGETVRRGPPGPGGSAGPGGPNRTGQNTIIAGAPQPAGTGNPAPNAPAGSSASPQDAKDFMSDPVVGWLVVTKGPGKGAGLALGKGMNTIGRGADNRVVLDFGDGSISREKHCVVTFEPKRRVFFIHNEGGTNLTYVGDAVVLQAQQLHNGEVIQVGDTEMRFVAFCGEDFSWDEEEE